MTRKILSNPPSGTATAFGGEDLNYVNQLLTGSDQSADPVSMATTTKFRSSKLQIGAGTGGNSFKYTIAGSAIASSVKITLPTLTNNREIVLANAVQTLDNKTMIRSPTASDTCLYPDSLNLPTVGKRKWTMYQGGSTTQNFGFAVGAVGGVSGSAFSTFTSSGTDGRYTTHATGTTAGNQTGQRIDSLQGQVALCLKPRAKLKFRMPTTKSAARFYFGLVANQTAFITGADPLGTPLEGYMIGFRDTDSNFQVVSNDNSGATTFADTGVAATADTIYTIEVKSPDATKFQWSINGSAFADTTTQIPASTTALYLQYVIETTDTNAKTGHLFYWYLEITDP